MSAYNYPQVKIDKSLSINPIGRREWTKVTITVVGDTRSQTTRVPVALVLALDFTGSMAAGNAYQTVAAAAKSVVGKLTPGTDQVALVALQDGVAKVLLPLTLNLVGFPQAIDNLQPNGLTNLQDAFIKTNDILKAATLPAKMAILMSDGVPYSDAYAVDWAQINYIMAHWNVPASFGIPYYTIGYGAEMNELLLDFLASKTGGLFQKAPALQDVAKTFDIALETGSKTLSTRNVVITEVVSPKLRVRDVLSTRASLRSWMTQLSSILNTRWPSKLSTRPAS